MQNYAERNKIQYFADILILIGLVILCAIVFGFLGAFLASAIYGIEISKFSTVISDTSETANIGFLKLYNAFTTLGSWVISGIAFCMIRNYKVNSLWKFKMPAVSFIWVLLPIIFISATFISAYLLDINQRLPIPESLRNMFDSFNTSGLLERMLYMGNQSDLLVNLVVIALLPAVFEEIFFRGTLQGMLSGLFNNHHIGIWLCSLIFALIHLNIGQIIPMMFLALVMGYLFHYTGSIYPSIAIHFLNNSFAVFAYYYQEKSDLAKKMVNDSFKPEIWQFVVFLLILVTIFMFIIQQHKLQNRDE